MIQFLLIIFGIAAASLLWSLYTMKKDGYFGKANAEEISKNPSKKGSIIFSGGTVKHIK